MGIFKIAILTISCVFSWALSAAEEAPITNTNTPIRIVSTDELKQPIEINRLELSADIFGSFSKTELTFEFHNPNSTNAALDFNFPLPEGSVIDGYSLDINGVLVDGVIVDKHKGRITFEKITRQNIDPGLVEKVQGNEFKTRIFPILSKNSRTIKVSYFTELGNELEKINYLLPFIHNKKIKNFSLRLFSHNTALEPTVAYGTLPNLAFESWSQGHQLKYSANNITLSKNLLIEIPKSHIATPITSQATNQQAYFAIKDVPKLPLSESRESLSEINLIWDASNSRKYANHQLELDLIERLLRKKAVSKVNLYYLRNTLNFQKSYVKSNGFKALLETLKTVNYDGGTDFSTLSHFQSEKSNSAAILIFTDGQDTFGKKLIPTLDSKTYVISTSQSNNAEFNRQLADKNYGEYYYLQSQASLPNVIQTIGSEKNYLTEIKVISGKVSNLPTLPLSLSNNSVLITGLLKSDEATIELFYKSGSKSVSSHKYQLAKSKQNHKDLAKQLWAKQQIKSLSVNKTHNKEKIISLSKAHNLVTDYTSLIVLENIEQYLEYAIEPPESLPQFRKEYFAKIKTIKKTTESPEEHLEKIYKLWLKREKWWSTKFPIDLKYSKEKRANVSSAEELGEENRVVVTGSRLRSDDLYDVEIITTRSEDQILPAAANLVGNESSSTSSIKLPKWTSNAEYLKTLQSARISEYQEKYYKLKLIHSDSPAFYFDVAAFFFNEGQTRFGLQVLSNIAELKLKDSRMLRTMATRLKQYDYLELAIDTYQTVLQLRPEEPQSYRDLALALAAHGKPNDLQKALDLLNHVIINPWDRFDGIQVTAITELNQLLSKVNSKKLDISNIDSRFIKNLPVQLRIVSSWDTDLTDIDLWVYEPSGEQVSYDNSLSRNGGSFHQDYTNGYGPEEYMLKTAPKGKYQIKVHYFGNNSPEISGATTLLLDIYVNYGSPNQTKKTISLRLDKANEDYLVGEITI